MLILKGKQEVKENGWGGQKKWKKWKKDNYYEQRKNVKDEKRSGIVEEHNGRREEMLRC